MAEIRKELEEEALEKELRAERAEKALQAQRESDLQKADNFGAGKIFPQSEIQTHMTG